jgi:hypothetical protein
LSEQRDFNRVAMDSHPPVARRYRDSVVTPLGNNRPEPLFCHLKATHNSLGNFNVTIQSAFDSLHLVCVYKKAKCILEYLIVLLRLETETAGKFLGFEGLSRIS